MTNLYELKLGAEKLEALLALFDEIKIIIEIMDRIDLTELKAIDANITANLARITELYNQARAILDEQKALSDLTGERLAQIQNITNEILPKFLELKAKIELFNSKTEQITQIYEYIVQVESDFKEYIRVIEETELNVIRISEEVKEKADGIGGASALITAVLGIDYASAYVADGFLYLGILEKNGVPYINDIGELILPYDLPNGD